MAKVKQRHNEGETFGYTVMNSTETECLGCIYIDPADFGWFANSEITQVDGVNGPATNPLSNSGSTSHAGPTDWTEECPMPSALGSKTNGASRVLSLSPSKGFSKRSRCSTAAT